MDLLLEDFFFIYGLILILIFHITKSTGLYYINKKFYEKNPWLSFFPILQYYNIIKAANESFLYYLIFPFLVIIITIAYMFFSLVTRSPSGNIEGILILISYLYLIIIWVRLNHGISKRCERGIWTTLGLLFIPFIMFPIVAYKLKLDAINIGAENLNEEKKETVEL